MKGAQPPSTAPPPQQTLRPLTTWIMVLKNNPLTWCCLLDAWKNFKQISLKWWSNGDLPWDRIRKKTTKNKTNPSQECLNILRHIFGSWGFAPYIPNQRKHNFNISPVVWIR